MDLWTRLNENPGDELVDLFDVSADDLGESAVRKLMGLQDRVLTTTRLALSPEDSRKPVPRGDNWLEHQVLMGWKRYFKLLTRKHVVLTDEGAAVLGKGYENRAQTEFEIDDDAIYKAFGDGGSERIDWKNKRDARNRRRTAGYIVYLKELWQDGPDCLSMFGMSGRIQSWSLWKSHPPSHGLFRRSLRGNPDIGRSGASIGTGWVGQRPRRMRSQRFCRSIDRGVVLDVDEGDERLGASRTDSLSANDMQPNVLFPQLTTTRICGRLSVLFTI
jgi:hypothetical protein